MRLIFEHMVTTVVMVLMLFVFTSIIVSEIQIVNARRVHTSAINQIQSSYYKVNIDDLNAKLQKNYPDWRISAKELSAINTRKDYIVRLDYNVVIPIFNIKKQASIEGYAR